MAWNGTNVYLDSCDLKKESNSSDNIANAGGFDQTTKVDFWRPQCDLGILNLGRQFLLGNIVCITFFVARCISYIIPRELLYYLTSKSASRYQLHKIASSGIPTD